MDKPMARRRPFIVGYIVLIALTLFLTGKNISISLHLSSTIGKSGALSFLSGTHHPLSTQNYQSSRPYLILHVGPPKTATTTLQIDLTQLKDELLKDNYLYAGAYYHTNSTLIGSLSISQQLRNVKCHKIMSYTRRTQGIQALRSVPCAQKIVQQFEALNGRHVIVSSETLSINWLTYYQVGRAPLDWISLKYLVPFYHIVVLVGYRYYFEWLLSSQHQTERWLPSKHNLNRWPISEGGRRLVPLLPRYLQIQPGANNMLPYYFTDTIVERIRPFIPVRIFHLHEHHNYTNLLSTFVCEMLPHATHTCAYTSSAPYHSHAANPQQSLDYDRVASAAEFLIPNVSHISRRQATLATRRFHQHTLQGEPLPMKCPENWLLEQLWNQSITVERQLFGQVNVTAHRHAFDNSRSKFCTVDTEALLRNNTWRHFFQSL